VIVDDASTDGTWDWLSQLDDPRIRPVRLADHSDQPVARNRGLAEARGEFILFLDDDDRLRPQALAGMAAALRADRAAVAAIGAKWRFEEWGNGVRTHHVRRKSTRQIWPEMLFGWGPIHGQTLFRARCLREVGGYDEENPVTMARARGAGHQRSSPRSRAADRELWFRIAPLGPVALVPDVVLEYRIHSGQWTSRVDPDDLRRVRGAIFKEFIDRLPSPERRRAERVRESARWFERATVHYARGNYRAALADHFRVCSAAPALCLSPITGPLLLQGLLRSLAHSLRAGRAR
jgi:glycosyltransferase involved in cell wall biosynthesis